MYFRRPGAGTRDRRPSAGSPGPIPEPPETNAPPEKKTTRGAGVEGGEGPGGGERAGHQEGPPAPWLGQRTGSAGAPFTTGRRTLGQPAVSAGAHRGPPCATAGTKDWERRSAFHHRAPDAGTARGERRSASRACNGRVCCACVARVFRVCWQVEKVGISSGKLREITRKTSA